MTLAIKKNEYDDNARKFSPVQPNSTLEIDLSFLLVALSRNVRPFPEKLRTV
jgi:hypothetical protein